MPDSIEERLARLGADLESAAALGYPSRVRARGDRFRAAHRRRMMTATATSAAVAVIGVAGVVALRPGGGHGGGPVTPGASTSSEKATPGTPTASDPTPSAVDTAKDPALAANAAVVDLSQHTLKVYDMKNRDLLRTLPISAGATDHPTRTGNFVVTGKQASTKIYSPAGVGDDQYDMTISWVVTLDGGGPQLYAAPWNASVLGKANKSHGEVGMSTEDAQWFYNHITVGDHITVQ